MLSLNSAFVLNNWEVRAYLLKKEKSITLPSMIRAGPHPILFLSDITYCMKVDTKIHFSHSNAIHIDLNIFAQFANGEFVTQLFRRWKRLHYR